MTIPGRCLAFVSMGLLAFTGACAPPLPSDTREADAKAVREAEAAWVKDIATKDVEKFVGHYTDDALLLVPNVPIINTKQALREALKPMLADSKFSLTFQAAHVEVSKSGDLAYTQGPYKTTFSGPKGEVLTDDGKYLTIWRKQADGRWKIVVDTNNSDMAPAAPSN